MTKRGTLVALGAIAVLAAACPRPTDGTPNIEVSPGAAGRAGLIPSRAGKTGAGASAAGAARVEPARVHPLEAGHQLGGPNATGRPGDWVLENDEVVFVVDGLGGGGGFAESGGNLIDAADAKIRKDELGQLFTYFGTFPRQGVYTSISSRQDPGGVAVVVSRGHELYEPSLEVTTEFRLAGQDRALLLRTTLKNTGTSPQTGLGLGDAIQWGGAEKFAPGKAVGFKGPSSGPFVGGIGRFTSYAITSTEGEIAAVSGGAWTDTEQKKNLTLAPGESVTYERVFVVGQRADAASVVSELTRASGGDLGGVEIALTDAKGAPVEAATGSKAILSTPAGQAVMSVAAASPGPTFGGEVPPGDWIVSYAPSAGRRGEGPKARVHVTKGQVAKAKLAVSAVGSLTAGCVEHQRVPCKITVEGVLGTATPDFGPGHVALAAKDQLFAATGDVTVPIAPGTYRLTASRGPEYTIATSTVTVPPGAGAKAEMSIRRAVDTTGYVAGDFHQHTILSADAPVGTADRVRSSAVEGVEIAVATEHNVVADLEPVVRDLGLTPFLVELPGDEMTTDASKHAWGHANVYPLEPRPELPKNGAFPVLGRSPKEVFADVRALGGERVLQVNHPRSGKNGYFDQLGFDPKTGVGTDPGYDAVFDAIEVWNGRVVAHRTRMVEDYLALLRTGHPVTPIADTDTHGIIGQEAGYPRTFVRVTKDDALGSWDAARTRDLVETIRARRDVVLSNGPFLAVRANGAGIGGLARAKKGVVDVEVHVEVAPWISVETAELRTAGGGSASPGPKVKLEPKRKPNGEALAADVTFRVRAAKDDAFVVIVSGSKPMRPMLSGDDAEIAPWAMSGPVWIDADGDGKSLGR
jgi:hypothetical protein